MKSFGNRIQKLYFDFTIHSPQVRRTLPRTKFPFRVRKGWTSTTGKSCKLAIYRASSKDGVGDVNIIPYQPIHPMSPIY